MKLRSEKGGIIAGLVVGILAVLALTATALFLTGWYLGNNIRVEHTQNRRGGLVRIETPLGTLRAQHAGIDPARFGVPVYPNANLLDRDGNMANVELDFGDAHKELSVIAAEYATDDSVEKVQEFYRNQLPHWIITKKRHRGFQMEYTKGGYKRFVVINEKDDRTCIALAYVGEAASN